MDRKMSRASDSSRKRSLRPSISVNTIILIKWAATETIHLRLSLPWALFGQHRTHGYSLQTAKNTTTKTCLYDFDPLKPLFYMVKQVIHYFFLFRLKTIDCEYSLEPPQWGYCNENPQSVFRVEIKKKISDFFYLKILSFRRKNFYICE